MTSDQVATVVVSRAADITRDVVATTPGAIPNIQVIAISGVRVVAIRAARVFFQVLGTALTAPHLVTVAEIQAIHWHSAVILAGFAALYSAIQNTTELLIQLDQRAPQWRA